MLDTFIELRDLLPMLSAIATTIGVVTIILNRPFRQSIARAFFVSSDSDMPRDEAKKIDDLQKEIELLRARLDAPVSAEATESIRKSLDLQLYSHIPEIVQKHLDRLSKDNDEIVNHFESEARSAAVNHLKSLPFGDLIDSAIYREAWQARTERSEAFLKLLEQQLASANATRMVMMNLFVLFNLLLLVFFVFSPGNYTEKGSLTVLGVYVSLSAFIIYIYRASNARSASLLSIKEDDKKLYDVSIFLNRFKKGNTFSNNEVELIKALLVNRLERERGADHPYEVILKGITNSNVLVRGGKIAEKKLRE